MVLIQDLSSNIDVIISYLNTINIMNKYFIYRSSLKNESNGYRTVKREINPELPEASTEYVSYFSNCYKFCFIGYIREVEEFL